MIAKVYSTKISQRWTACSCGEVKEHLPSYHDGHGIYVINCGQDTYIGKSGTIRSRIKTHSRQWAKDDSDVHMFYLTEKDKSKASALEQNLITYCFKNTTWKLLNKPSRHKNYVRAGDTYGYWDNERSKPYGYLPEEYKASILKVIKYVDNYFVQQQTEFRFIK
tara:strand:- start:363 stop:854 length:492 start_codon:yes stop_codon:yes gene_type:complete